MPFVSLPGISNVVVPAPAVIAAVAASSLVTSTVAETVFDNSGQQITANTLKAGDVIEFEMQGICPSTNGSDTLTVKFKLGTTVVIATSAVDVTNNDIFTLRGAIQIRTIGAGGTMVAWGTQILGTEGTATKNWKLASTALDTTAAIALNATATWSASSASDTVRLDVFRVNIVRLADQFT